jgi:hypothetical protein
MFSPMPLSGAVIGGLLGGWWGYSKGFALRLEAQMALCQTKIEQNTRALEKIERNTSHLIQIEVSSASGRRSEGVQTMR